MNATPIRRREFLKVAGLFASGVCMSGCSSHLKTAQGLKRPNILWITCEDTSPYLGCYGDPNAITPNLDRLAEEGTLYTQAYVTAPVCAPVRSCLITGVYATSLGTQHLRSEMTLPEAIEPFPKLLGRTGYYCSNNYKEDYNFTDPTIWDDSSHSAHWRNRAPGQPFFSVFNIMATHQGQINGTDEEFFEKYRSRLTPQERHDPQTLPLPPYFPDTPVVRNIWGRYYDLITTMDKQVGELLAQLEADGLADDTIVFFFADHGLGLPRFKRTLYDSGLHIPLMVRFGANVQTMASQKAGTRSDRLISTIDLPPTVLQLTGVTVPGYMQGASFLDGSSASRQYVFGAASRVDEAYEMSRCIRDKRYKYIRNFMPHLGYIQPSEYPDRAEIMQELRRAFRDGEMTAAQERFWLPVKPLEELYDTQADPYELTNLATSAPHDNVLKQLRRELLAWMVQTRDTGLLPEGEMHIRAAGSTPYEVAHDPQQYPLRRILDVAQLVGTGPQVTAVLKASLQDSDSAVRYWAAVAFEALGNEAAPAKNALEIALNDTSPNVRFAVAGVLCRLGDSGKPLDVLAEGLEDPRETVVLHAARTLQELGDKACPVIDRMAAARQRCKDAEGNYKNDDHAMFIDWALKGAMANCQ